MTKSSEASLGSSGEEAGLFRSGALWLTAALAKTATANVNHDSRSEASWDSLGTPAPPCCGQNIRIARRTKSAAIIAKVAMRAVLTGIACAPGTLPLFLAKSVKYGGDPAHAKRALAAANICVSRACAWCC
ncbi:hypothetical protein FRZ44_14300 [Hypericibacter terrae]|uniref:Uncharacterized protein n=1 Tax=Hypericibacter terrae TaxID=2602015 RepID=A0A5J6MFC1_9PROT|nr:hypothetical protein FRZ44_14300 [Hypericibacter terrae]